MQCPRCHAEAPDGSRYCTSCGADLAAASQTPQPVAPQTPQAAPVTAQPVTAQTPAAPAEKKPTPPWLIACGVSCGIILLIVLLGVATFFILRMTPDQPEPVPPQPMDGTVSGVESSADDMPIGPAGPPSTGYTSSAPATGLVGTWDVVYWSAEGDWPSAVEFRTDGDQVVGTVIGLNETGMELSEGGEDLWFGTYRAPYQPDGVRISATLTGADRVVIAEEEYQFPPTILVAERRGGSDFGPNPRAETEDDAIEAVAAFPEVAEWLNAIEQAQAEGRQTSARFAIDDEFATHYIVHVFEMVEDDGGGGHTATFGRYYVYKRSAVVVYFDGA